jgi:hypothetical protein
MYTANNADVLAGLMGMIAAIIIPLLIVGLILYVYTSWATMTIANRLKVPNGWLAFIPIANFYLLTQIAEVPWWTFLIVFATIIPFVGWYFAAPLIVPIFAWWFIRIAKRLKRDEMWGILLFMPLVNLVILGMMAWGDADNK